MVNRKLGMATAIGAQFLWGVFPAYIKLFKDVIDPLDFVAHRALWSFLVLIIWVAIASRRSSRALDNQASLSKRLLGNSATIRMSLFAAMMIAINWLMFVWAVSNDHAIDASLGYYICPQLVVLLGVVYLKERLSTLQWTAVALAAIGVITMAWSANSRIWIGLVVAIAFAVYALVKKKTHLSAAEGLTLETGFMLLPAVGFLLWRSFVAGATVIPESTLLFGLLACCGLFTVAPLFLYAIAVKHLNLSTVGLLQFIGPTIQFFLGVFAFAEPVDSTRLLGFVLVWIGVSLYLFALSRRRATEAV